MGWPEEAIDTTFQSVFGLKGCALWQRTHADSIRIGAAIRTCRSKNEPAVSLVKPDCGWARSSAVVEAWILRSTTKERNGTTPPRAITTSCGKGQRMSVQIRKQEMR